MFSRCKSVQYLDTDEIDDHRIQSDYKCTIWPQTSRGKNSVLGIASAWWNRARHRWQRDHQDPEHLLHSAHEHWHVKWICAQFSSLFLFRFRHAWLKSTSWLKGVAHVISSMHEVCGSPSTLMSILFYFLIFQFILNLLNFLLHFFHYLDGSSNTAHSAEKEMDSLDDSYLLTEDKMTRIKCKWR